jgi:hypothetical protein
VAIEVAAATLDGERASIVECLSRYLTERPDEARFDWLYRQSPHGPARAWVARDRGRIVGVAAAFPRRMLVRGAPETAWVLGDFCVAEDYRTLGPAVRLQRACLEGIDAGHAAFAYDFPSEAMTGIYHRLGIKPHGQVVRWARRLRVDPTVRRLVPDGRLAAGVSRLGNTVLALVPPFGAGRGVRVRVHEGGWTAIATLARAAAASYEMFVDRSADYLEWRYGRNPTCRYTVLTAETAGGTSGYAILAQGAEHVVVADLIAPEDASRAALLRAAVVRARRDGVVTVSVPILDGDPLGALARRAGFSPRESRPLVVYAGVRPRIDVGSHRWLVLHGDRDS